MPQREILIDNTGTMFNETMQKLKAVREADFLTVFYLTPNNQIKTKIVYQQKNPLSLDRKLYSDEDLAQIANDFLLNFNNDYLFIVDEPSFVVGVYGIFNDQLYHAQSDFLYSSLTPLELFSMNAYGSGYVPEYLEESDYRPANTLSQVFCEFTVQNP